MQYCSMLWICVIHSIRLYYLQTNMETWASTVFNRHCSEAFAKSWEADIWLYCWECDTCTWVQPHGSTSASQNWSPTPAHCQRWLWQCIWVSFLFVPPNHLMAFSTVFDSYGATNFLVHCTPCLECPSTSVTESKVACRFPQAVEEPPLYMCLLLTL